MVGGLIGNLCPSNLWELWRKELCHSLRKPSVQVWVITLIRKNLCQSPLLTGFVWREPGDARSPGISVVLSASQIVIFYSHHGQKHCDLSVWVPQHSFLQKGDLFGLAVSIPHVYPCLGGGGVVWAKPLQRLLAPVVSGCFWPGHKFLVYLVGEK